MSLKPFLSAERTAATAGRLRVRSVEAEAFAKQAGVVLEHRAVQVQETLLVDENFCAVGPLEDFVAEPRLSLPREGVAQARAAAAFHADPQTAVGDALLGHQRANLLRRGVRNLDHLS